MNKQRSGRKLTFSVIDFVIILVIVALAVGIIARYDIVDRLFSKTSLSDARVTFIAEAITPEEKKVFTDNSVFYVENEEFGVLNNATSEKALIFRENSDGSLVSYEDDTLLDLSGTFTVSVLKTDKGYLLNGNRFIAAGSIFIIKHNGAEVRITVTSLEVVK